MARLSAVVIGGGAVGVCCAYYLARAGCDVTLVEKNEICAGCSYGNAGMVVPSHSIPLAAPGVWLKGLRWMLDPASPFYIRPRLEWDLAAWLWRFRAACNPRHVRRALPILRDLSFASQRLFQNIRTEEDFDFGYRQDGVLTVFRTEHGYSEGIAEARLLQEAGITAEILEGQSVRELEPSLLPSIRGGVFCRDDGSVIPDVFVRGLANIAARMGVQIQTRTEVLGFRTIHDKVLAVETTRGDIETEHIVLAVGSWSSALGAALKLQLPIQPAKGYSLTYHLPPNSPKMPMILSEARVGVTPMGHMLRLGGTLELSGLDFSVDQRRLGSIERALPNYVRLDGLKLIEIWRGLRPLTPDGLPILGRSKKIANLVVATGHAMLGISLGPITGKIVAQLVRDEQTTVDVSTLTPDRFC